MARYEFRVYLLVAPPGKPAYVKVNTLQEAMVALNTMVALRENFEERDFPSWEDDISGLEYRDLDNLPTKEDLEENPYGDPEGWETWYDQDGEEIDYYYRLEPEEYKEFENKTLEELTIE